MKKILLLAVVCVLFAWVALAGSDDRSLIVVEGPDPGAWQRLLAADLMVVRDLGSYLLVVAEPGQLPELDRAGVTWETLDSGLAGKTYFTVSVRDRAQLDWVGSVCRVLHRAGREAVIEATPAAVDLISAAGHEVARVFLRPIRLAPAVKPLREITAGRSDPVIEDIVAAVSTTQIDAYVQRLQDFVTRYCTHDSCQAAANYIKAHFESVGIDSTFFHEIGGSYKPNVVAVIPGVSEPEKTVVIGGHYDSITSDHNNCPGADDNASGTACVMECARVMAGHQFDYTVKFVAFGAEEVGLYGSEAFASDAAGAGEDIVAAVCVDMIGYLAGGDVLDLDIIDNASSQWIRDLAMSAGAEYVPELPLVDGSLPGGASSDHASFWANGYDAILFFEDTGDYSPYIHTTSDIVGLSYNSPVLAVRSVRVAAALMASLAQPYQVAIAHTPLENTEDTLNPYRVVADITAAGTLNPDSLLVYYSTGGGMNDLSLTATGYPDEYEAFIPAQPGGTFVDYYLVAEDTESNRAVHPAGAPAVVHTFFVGVITPVVYHDLETEQGWTVGDVDDDATSGIWERVDPNGTWEGSILVQPEDDHTPDPGSQCFITGQSPPGAGQGDNDVDGGKTTLFSPVFDLSTYGNAWVRYHRWYTNDTGYNPQTDEWVVDVTDNGGTNWVRLETFPGSDRSWQMVERNLQDYISLTSQVQFRFIAADDPSGSVVEAGMDDFYLVVYQEPTAVAPAAGDLARPVILGQNVPNPFNPATVISFRVPAPGRRVTLRIFDVRGRVVKTLLQDEMVAGERAVTWTGQDDRGRPVASGTFFYRLETDDRDFLTRKLMLVR